MAHDQHSDIGRNITVAMAHANVSLRELAALSGISRRAISRIINGEVDARWSIIKQLAKWLRISPQDLVSPTIPALQTYTGHRHIDNAVIAVLLCEASPDMTAEASQYIDANYRCSSTHYKRGATLPVQPMDAYAVDDVKRAWSLPDEYWEEVNRKLAESVGNIEILGISWEDEQAANKEWRSENKFHHRSIRITHIFMQGARRVTALTEMRETRMTDLDGDTLPTYVERDGLLMERTIYNCVSLVAAHPFRIDESPKWVRKYWNAYNVVENHRMLGRTNAQIKYESFSGFRASTEYEGPAHNPAM